MKQVFLGFLMLLMLTPSMVCAMPICAQPARAVKLMTMSEMPCHDMDHHGDKAEKKSNSSMLMKDCMGLELQVADNGPVIHKPDLSKDVPVILAFNVQPVSVWTSGNVSSIRGPPPDWPSYSQTKPSIILTTQRLRI